MKKVLFILYLLFPIIVNSQTYYYDKNWKGVEKEEFAEYKRVLSPSTDPEHYKNKYRDFFITGEKQGEGEYIEIDPYDDSKSKFDGEQITYYKNGNISSRFFFKDNKRIGPFENFFDNGLIARKGITNENGLDGLYTEFQGDGTICVQIEYKDGKPINDYYVVSNNLGCVSKYRISDNTPIYTTVNLEDRKTEFIDDIEWQYYVVDGITVAMGNDKVYDYGNFFSFPIIIDNATMSEIVLLPEKMQAYIVNKDKNKPLEILSRKEYMAKVDKSQAWSRFFKGLGAAATASAAGTSTSSTEVNTTNVNASSVHGSYDASTNAYGAVVGAGVGAGVGSGGWGVGASAGAAVGAAHANMHGNTYANGVSVNSTNTTARTTNYNGAAAYQAYIIERERVEQYDEQLAKDREAHNEGYLKRTTIHPGEKISGLIYAKKAKGEKIYVTLELNNQIYNFDWNAPK
ncbi:MAG: hypothetical protein IJK49_08690 [Prevotella sp.]|nr:hypothetical protein [Prevotella sp.]